MKLLNIIIKLIKIIFNKCKKILLNRKKKAVDTKENVVAVINNGVAVSESILLDGALNGIDIFYLMVLIYKFDITKGYTELSYNELIMLLRNKNKNQIARVYKRLEENGIVKVIKGKCNEKNKYLILKHMTLITDSSIKIDTSYKNSEAIVKNEEVVNVRLPIVNKENTISNNKGNQVVDINQVSLKGIALEDGKAVEKDNSIDLINYTCMKNIEIIDEVSKGYKKLYKLVTDNLITENKKI